MVRIKDLPGGDNFHATLGAGSFSRRLTNATRAGELSNLRDNRASIIKVLKKNESAIRRGAFDRLCQISAWNTVKKMEGEKLTKNDAKEIKQLLHHLGEESEAQAEEKKIKMDLALDKDASFANERNQEAKARLLGKAGRFGHEWTGGESKMKFSSRPEGVDQESMSVTGRLLSRRLNPKADRFKANLPLYRVNWREEKEKRLEVADIERDLEKKMSKKPSDKPKAEPEKKRGSNAFRLTDL